MNKYTKALDLLLKDDNIKEVLKIVRNNKLRIEFALYCAKRVQHVNSNTIIKKAIKAIERWMLNPSEKNREKIADICDCVIDDYPTEEADYAAYAVYYTMLAICSRNATHWANYGAYYATCALDNEDEERYHQVQYLKQLLLNKMPEKDKGWFVKLIVNAG